MASCSRNCAVCGKDNFLERGYDRSFTCSRCKTANTLGEKVPQYKINQYLQNQINKIRNCLKD